MKEDLPLYISWNESKCPYTKVKTFVLWLFNTILWSNEDFTILYWIKELWLINDKKRFDKIYNELDRKDLLDYLENWWNIEIFCKTKWLDIDIIKRMIEREFSILVFSEFYEYISKLSLFSLGDFSQIKENNSKDILISKFSEIIIPILEMNLKTTQIGNLALFIDWLEYPKNDRFNISWRLYHLFMEDSISLTISSVLSHINKIKDSNVKINKELILECFKNSSRYFTESAISNQPLYYFNWDKKPKIDRKYDVENNKFYLWLKEKDFDSIYISNNFQIPKWIKKEYMWCPVLFSKIDYWGNKYNWILAYQLKIAELLCDLEWYN